MVWVLCSYLGGRATASSWGMHTSMCHAAGLQQRQCAFALPARLPAQRAE